MATIIEHDAAVHRDTAGTSIAVMIVAFLILVVVAGVAVYGFTYYGRAAADTNGGIQVDVNGTIPTNPAPTTPTPAY